MAGTRMRIDISELAQLQAFLADQAARDTGSLMHPLGEYLTRSTQARFKSQTAPDGTPWAPLQPGYARRKKYNRDKILTLRGYLRSFIHHQVLDEHSVEVGSNQIYAAAHQFGNSFVVGAHSRVQRYRSVAGRVLFAGAKHKRGVTEKRVTTGAYMVNLPARPFLGISAADELEIQAIIQDWLAGQGR